jgi:hypothetical protein
MRTPVLFVLSLFAALPQPPAAAAPAPSPAALEEQVLACGGLELRWESIGATPPKPVIAPAGTDLDRAVYDVRLGRERLVVFALPGAEPGYDCAYVTFGTPAATAQGRFGERGAKVQAFALLDRSGEECPATVGLLDGSDRLVVAARTPDSCCGGVALSAVSLFPGHETVSLHCSAGTGGEGGEERLLLFDLRRDVLSLVLDVPQGRETRSDERVGDRMQTCTTPAAGTWKVEEKGATPVLIVFQPDAELALEPGSVTGSELRYRFDPAGGHFRPQGAAEPKTVEPKRVCRPAAP